MSILDGEVERIEEEHFGKVESAIAKLVVMRAQMQNIGDDRAGDVDAVLVLLEPTRRWEQVNSEMRNTGGVRLG